MEGLFSKVLVVGIIYLIFIVVYGIFRARYIPPSLRSRRARSLTGEASGFATTESQKSDRKLGYLRIITTVLVAVSIIALGVILYFGLKI